MINILYYLLFFCILFPYTSLVNIGTDTSIMYLIVGPFAFMVYLTNIASLKFNRKIIILANAFITMGILSIVVGIFQNDLIKIRYGVGYMAFVFTFIIFYNIGLYLIKQNQKKFIRRIKNIYLYSVSIWVFAGLIQLFFKLQGSLFGFKLTNFLVTTNILERSTIDRGILSLSVEPSYLGIITSLFLGFNYFIYTYNLINKNIFRKMQYALIALTIFSMSVVSYLLLLIYILSIAKIKIRYIVGIPMVLLVVILFINNFHSELSQYRFFYLITSIYENPIFLVEDLSSASRLAAILSPWLSLGYENNWIGFLIHDNQGELLHSVLFDRLDPNFAQLLSYGLATSNKLKSTYGVFVYQYGLFGVFSIVLLNFIIIALFKKNIQSIKPLLIISNFAYLIQTPLTLPTIPAFFAIALVIYKMYPQNNSVCVKMS